METWGIKIGRRLRESVEASRAAWPTLPLAAWQDTYATLRMGTQIVGKVRLTLGLAVNHCWGDAKWRRL